MNRHPVQGGMEGQPFELCHAAETGIRSCMWPLASRLRNYFTLDEGILLSISVLEMRGVIIINKA